MNIPKVQNSTSTGLSWATIFAAKAFLFVCINTTKKLIVKKDKEQPNMGGFDLSQGGSNGNSITKYTPTTSFPLRIPL